MADIIPIDRKLKRTIADPILKLYSDCGITVTAGDRKRIREAMGEIKDQTGIVPVADKIIILNARRVD